MTTCKLIALTSVFSFVDSLTEVLPLPWQINKYQQANHFCLFAENLVILFGHFNITRLSTFAFLEQRKQFAAMGFD